MEEFCNWLGTHRLHKISHTLVGNTLLIIVDLHSRLNTRLQWIGQRQLQDGTRNIYVSDLVRPILDVWRYVFMLNETSRFPGNDHQYFERRTKPVSIILSWQSHCTKGEQNPLYDIAMEMTKSVVIAQNLLYWTCRIMISFIYKSVSW